MEMYTVTAGITDHASRLADKTLPIISINNILFAQSIGLAAPLIVGPIKTLSSISALHDAGPTIAEIKHNECD